MIKLDEFGLIVVVFLISENQQRTNKHTQKNIKRTQKSARAKIKAIRKAQMQNQEKKKKD